MGNNYIIVYNAQSDFIIGETNHPETLIADLIKEGYAQDDIQIYATKELNIEVGFKEIVVKLK